jgi:drug/metabolite transporter (DMT)-like permease
VCLQSAKYGISMTRQSNPPPPHHQKEHHDRLALAVFLSLLVWFIFTCMTALSKSAQKTASIPMILLFQNCIGVLFTLPYVIKHHFHKITETNFRLIIIRSISGQLNFGFLLLAIQDISLANSMLLNNTAPLIIPILAWLWLSQKVQLKIWPGLIIGFIGVLCILKPNQQIFSLGAIYALTAAFCLAVVMMSLRLLAFKEHPFTVLFYFFLTGLLIAVPLSFFYWTSLDMETVLKLIGIGILMCVGQYILVLSFRFAKPITLAPFSFSAIVYALFFDWILWNTVPDYISFLGILLVCIGGIFTIIYSNKPSTSK